MDYLCIDVQEISYGIPHGGPGRDVAQTHPRRYNLLRPFRHAFAYHQKSV